MRYVITRRVMGYSKELPISCASFQALKVAKRGLIVLMSIEEKFAILVANYHELEADLLERSLNSLIYRRHDYGAMHDDRVELSRRLSNLLSSARAYADQVKHDWSSLRIDADPGYVPALFSKEYDER